MSTSVSVRQALQRVADYPTMLEDNLLQVPAHELVCRVLFEMANQPDPKVRGSMGRANTARKLIMDRLVGKRRPGSHPATRAHVAVEFIDLTGQEIGEADESDRDNEEVPDSDSGGPPNEPRLSNPLALEAAVRDDPDDLPAQP